MQVITICVERGLLDIWGIEPGTLVKVHDYDIQDDEGEDIRKDDSGRPYRLTIYSTDKVPNSDNGPR